MSASEPAVGQPTTTGVDRDVPRLRSLLFAPASRPDMLRKMPRCHPDGIVLDLEDAVAPQAKTAAREHCLVVAPELREANPRLVILVRINAVPTAWFADDLEALHPSLTGIVVPKVETLDQLDRVATELAARGLGQLRVVAGVETVAGVVRSFEIAAHPCVTWCYFGAEDYVADLGGVRTESSTEVLYARSRVAMAARLAGVGALDQVVTVLDDRDLFARDAAQGRALGYRGKLCIHPTHVTWANEAFVPSRDEIDRARRLIGAFQAAQSRGEASIAFEGQMVDEPLARQARAIIAAADIAEGE
jgi:citrate lyase subunit beta / citryl-CoA lyase